MGLGSTDTHNENFGRIVWDFLADRRCKAIHASLGSLYTRPNFLDRYENHLRCTALLTRKPLAAKVLGLAWINYDQDWGEPCKLLTTTLSWQKTAMSNEWLEESNVFGISIYETAKEFAEHGESPSLKAQRFLREHDWGKSIETIQNCKHKNTIWRPVNSPNSKENKVCIEGNKRMHSLAFKLHKHGQISLEGWNAWIANG